MQQKLDEPIEIANEKQDEFEEVTSHLNLKKFTIDLNTLKADMKKKSAKLLSKLSVTSNNCNLVKSLVKQDELEQEQQQPQQQQINKFSINSNTALKLKVEENFQLSSANDTLLHHNMITNGGKSNGGCNTAAVTKLNAFIENLNEDELEWLNSIEFKFDSATAMSKPLQNLAEFLERKKQSCSSSISSQKQNNEFTAEK